MSSDHGEGPSAAATEHDQLKRLGKYEIQRKLGAGGMGTVFLAIDQDLRRTVALKVLPRERAENAILVRRFKAEAQAAAQLHHKNIVGVYEAGEADGLLYIALEYIDGTDALHLIHRRGVLPVKRSIEIVRGVAEALQHAFEKNIVHRDIKPSNLMIAKDGEVKLADMGLARSIDDTLDTSITRAGTTVGTVDYMAPEQARNSKAADIRSDLYSLGCTWYHLLTGEPPFGEGDIMAKVQAHALKPPPDPQRLNDRIPDAVVAVIQRLMAKKPQDRYQTPRDLLEDLANPNLHRQGVTSDILASLGQAHVDEPVVEEVEEFEETDGGPAAATNRGAPAAKGRGPAAATNDSGRASGRSSNTPSSSSSGKKGASSGTRPTSGKTPRRPAAENVESLIGQALDEEDQAEKKTNRKKSTGDRALPDRIDAQKVEAGITQMSIDPAFFQIGLVVLLVATVVGAIAWVLKSGASRAVEDQGNLAAIVQRNNELNAQPTAPPPMPASEAPMPAVVTPDPIVPSVATIKYSGPQDESPFPGLAASAAQGDLLPAWVPYTRGSAPDDVAVVKVRRFRTEPGEVATVGQIGNRDRVVLEFLDEGPHAIPASALGKIKWLGLRGKNVRPALVVSGAPDASGAVFGGVRGGSLKIEGIDLHWDVPDGKRATLVSCLGGDVLLRNSTVAIIGAGDASAAAIQMKGVAGTVTRGVFENVVLRNEAGGAIATEGPGIEFVAGNLLSLTRGTVLRIGPAALSPPPQLPATRVGIFFQSTLVTEEGLLFARHEGNAAPAAVELRFDRTLAVRRSPSAGKDSATVPAITLSGWPDSPPEDAEAARPQGFKLQGEGVQLAGWGTLTQPSSGTPVTDAIGWRLFWRHQIPSENLVAATPAAVAGWTRPYGSLPMETLSADLKGAALKLVEGSPGAKYGDLPAPPVGLSENIAALSDRPRIPAAVSRPADGGEVRFDLKKGGTLNRFLNSECPDNARVIAFGAGLKLIEPVVLKNKSLTIVFEQSEGAPLQIQPLSRGGANDKNAPEAFFSIGEGARLELINGRFDVLFTKGKSYPKRLAVVSESSCLLTNCTIEGSHSPDAPVQSLVQVNGGAGATSYLVCRNSFLRGQGPLIDITGPRVHTRIENSLLISARDGIALAGDTSKGILDLESVTVSAGGATLRTAADNSGDTRLFVTESLFVPPAAATASLFLDDGNGAGKRIAWWGLANAYSSRLADFVVGEGRPAGKQDFDRDWVNVWGPGHDLRPASGEQAVLLEAPLGKLTELKPEAYALKAGCLAAIWDERGGPVGANLSGLGAPEVAKPTPMNQPKPMEGAPKKPGNGF